MDFKHRYGSVELYLQEEEVGPQIWARYAGAVQQGTCGPLLDTVGGPASRYGVVRTDTGELEIGHERELCVYRRVEIDHPTDLSQFAYGEPLVVWVRHNGPHKGKVAWRTDWDPTGCYTDESQADQVAPLFNPEVLEAAVTLLLDDYWAFQEADRAMGDPYP